MHGDLGGEGLEGLELAPAVELFVTATAILAFRAQMLPQNLARFVGCLPCFNWSLAEDICRARCRAQAHATWALDGTVECGGRV